jgi:hypothetical protein
VSSEMIHMTAKELTLERREDFLERVERLCVCMCVCVFLCACLKMKLTWSMSRGWNLRLKVHSLQILYMCPAATHLSGTLQNLDRKRGCLTDTADLSKTLFALGSSCQLSSHTYADVGDSFLHPLFLCSPGSIPFSLLNSEIHLSLNS